MGMIFALAAACLFATVNILVRLASRRGSLDDCWLLTVLFNAVVFSSVLAITALRREVPSLHPVGLVAFAGAGIATTFAGRRLLFASVRAIGPGRSLPFKVSAPVFSIALGYLFFREAITPGLVVGTVAVGIGLWVLSVEIIHQEHLRRLARYAAMEASEGGMTQAISGGSVDPDRHWYSRGVFLGVLSGACFGGGYFLRKLGLLQIPSELVGATIGSLVALAGATSVRTVARRRGRLTAFSLRRLPWEFWASGALLSVALLAQFAALRLAPVSRVSVVGAAEVLLTIAGAAMFVEDEHLTLRVIGSAVLVFSGVALVVLR